MDALKLAKEVKPVKASTGVTTTPAEQAVIDQHRGTGLEFPEHESARRLVAKAKRKPDAGKPANPRTVISAPLGSNLPDFVTGDINFNDWIKRHEHILEPHEIKHASEWYKRIYPDFQQYQPDPNKVKKDAKAWLVAQQNISPAGAMNNVLMQKEQMARGVPEHLWTAGGMPNPTAAARNVLRDQPIAGGVGQKIADFVDSAEGKPVRSWMGNHPKGGAPFVVDVHTARDTGMVDQELINHLTKLGYDPKKLAKLKIDMAGTPSEAAYENRGDFGRALTDHLKKIGWQGRKDWTPEEAQAVGWMGMTKLTRNAEEDSESGLGRNFRRISYEIAPGSGSPWEKKYGAALEGLPEADRYAITHSVAEHAMDHASKLSGIDVHSLVHGTGAWKQYQNPATVAQSLSTQKGADIAANALGYLLNQTEVWHNRAKSMTANPKGFGIDFIERGSNYLADKNKLSDFWQKIMAADDSGLLEGYQPITLPTGETGIRALIPKGGEKTKQALENSLRPGGALDTTLSQMPFNVTSHGHEAEITKARNDWSKNPNGETYLAGLGEALGRDPSAELHSARSHLEAHLENHLDEAHARQGTTWRGPQTPPSGPVGGGFNRGGRTRRAYKKGGKVEGAIWHARDAFDEGGEIREGDGPGGLRGDTGAFATHDVGESQGAVNAATASAQDAQQGMRDMNNTFGKGFSDVASAIGNAIISPAEAKENPPQLAKSFINPHETVNAALASGRADVAPSGLMHGVGTEKDVSEANAAEAAAARMDQAFGQPVGTTTFNTPPLGGGAFELPRSATGTPAESLLSAVQPSTPEPMQPAPNANLAVATPGVSQPVTPPNAYAQGQMPQPTGESPSNPFADIANKYTTAANTGIAGMQGYNAGTYANQMPQPTGPINPYAQGQMPQPSGPSDASVRAARDAITQNMGGNAPSTQPTAPSTQPMPTAGNVPTPPIPLRDLQGPSIAEGIAGAFGLSTQQQFDKFYKGYIDQGHNELDAYNKAISDIQTMRSNAKPGPFDKGGKRQMIQQIMPDGTIQMVPAPYKRGGGVHNSQMVDHVLTKFGASLPASSNPYFGNMAGRRR